MIVPRKLIAHIRRCVAESGSDVSDDDSDEEDGGAAGAAASKRHLGGGGAASTRRFQVRGDTIRPLKHIGILFS